VKITHSLCSNTWLPVSDALAVVGINEAMNVAGAIASFIREIRAALEAELCGAVPANHLVALPRLRTLLVQVLLGDDSVTAWASLAARLRGPALECGLVLGLGIEGKAPAPVRGATALVPGPCTTLDAASLLTLRAVEPRVVTFLQRHRVGAIWRGTTEEVLVRRNGLLKAPLLQQLD